MRSIGRGREGGREGGRDVHARQWRSREMSMVDR